MRYLFPSTVGSVPGYSFFKEKSVIRMNAVIAAQAELDRLKTKNVTRKTAPPNIEEEEDVEEMDED